MTAARSIHRIGVLGAGSWGTTVANLLAGKGFEVAVWAREPELAGCLSRGSNPRYLPGLALHPNLRGASALSEALDGSDLVVFAIPAQSLRQVLRQIDVEIPADVLLLNLAKGIEEGSGARCSEILFQELKSGRSVGALSGPNIAWEIVQGVPSKAVVACSNYRHLARLRETFSTPCFRVYENADLAGTELGGAIKNVIAIMAGIGDGLGFGVNTKSAVITRGLQEMVRIGAVMGGHRETFFGLAGIGDLMATALSAHSRNRTLGEHLGRGATLDDAQTALRGRVAEGIVTAKALFEITHAFDLETPIIEATYRVLYEGLSAREGYLAIWNPGGRFEGES
jgi:glycerol-3-phosphate dehydrogenase (NAD(P)+)